MEFELDFELEEDGRWIAEIVGFSGAPAYGSTQDDARLKAVTLAGQVRAGDKNPCTGWGGVRIVTCEYRGAGRFPVWRPFAQRRQSPKIGLDDDHETKRAARTGSCPAWLRDGA